MPGPPGSGQKPPMFADPAKEWWARRFAAGLRMNDPRRTHGLRFGQAMQGKAEIDWAANEEALDNQHADIHELASQLTVTRREPPARQPVRRAIKHKNKGAG